MKIDKKRGFTLVELMIVIAVMGIMAVIAAPNFVTYLANQRLKGAARMVMSDLMAARQKAVTQNVNITVTFTSNHQYTITNDASTRDIQQDYSDVTFTSSGAAIFYPRGNATGTTVTLTSSRTGSQKFVRVALNGRVKIDDT